MSRFEYSPGSPCWSSSNHRSATSPQPKRNQGPASLRTNVTPVRGATWRPPRTGASASGAHDVAHDGATSLPVADWSAAGHRGSRRLGRRDGAGVCRWSRRSRRRTLRATPTRLASGRCRAASAVDRSARDRLLRSGLPRARNQVPPSSADRGRCNPDGDDPRHDCVDGIDAAMWNVVAALIDPRPGYQGSRRISCTSAAGACGIQTWAWSRAWPCQRRLSPRNVAPQVRRFGPKARVPGASILSGRDSRSAATRQEAGA